MMRELGLGIFIFLPKLLDSRLQSRLDLVLVEVSYLLLVGFLGLLESLLMLPILHDFFVDCFSDLVIVLNLLSAFLTTNIDLFSEFRHFLLEFVCQLNSFSLVLLQHQLVLVIQFIVLFEERPTKVFEKFALLYVLNKCILSRVPISFKYKPVLLRNDPLLECLLERSFHDFRDFVAKLLESFGRLGKTCIACEEFLPVVDVLLELPLELCELLCLDLLKLFFLVSEVRCGCEVVYVILELSHELRLTL
jgi:hypothetical protein